MDTIVGIFTELSVDQSLIYQFIVVLTMFLLMKFLFLGKMQNIIEIREEKTTKLEGSADAKMEEIEKLSKDYELRISKAHSEAQKILSQGKLEFKKDQDAIYKKSQEKINHDLEVKRRNMHGEIEAQKSTILSSSDSLVNSLIEKVTLN